MAEKTKIQTMENGYVLIDRGIFSWCDEHIPQKSKKLTKKEALLWLIMHSCWDTMEVDGVKLKEGEFHWSLKELAEAWLWKKCDVPDFLKALVTEGCLEKTIVKDDWIKYRFLNWKKYQKKGKIQGTPQGTPNGTPQGTPQGTHNDLNINIVTESHGTPNGTPQGTPNGTPQGTHNNIYGENSSPDGSSFSPYITEKTNKEENNNPSLPLGVQGGAAGFPVFSEEKGQNPSGVYQPKPVEPTVYQTSQSFPLKEVKEPFSVDEVCRRLSDKFINFGAEHRALIEAKYSFIRKNGFVKKMDNTLWTIDGFIIWMSDELEKKGLLAKKNSSGVISRNGKRYVDSSQEGLDYLRSLGVKVF